MSNNPITFDDELAAYQGGIDDEPLPLGPQGVAAILAWLKLNPEERVALERRRTGSQEITR